MAPKVLILGGTGEAVALARMLSADPRFAPVLSLAGRTREPQAAGVETRIGGFGGAGGLARYLAEAGIAALVDATHPFAVRISANAVEAANAAGVPRLALVRPPWTPSGDDRWREVSDEAAAAEAVPAGGRGFLALGRQRLAPFAGRADVWWLVRVVDPPEEPLVPGPHLTITGRGPFSEADERELLTRHRISHVVARNSGGVGGRAKIDAARVLRLPVVMIARPASPAEPSVAGADDAIEWLTRLI